MPVALARGVGEPGAIAPSQACWMKVAPESGRDARAGVADDHDRRPDVHVHRVVDQQAAVRVPPRVERHVRDVFETIARARHDTGRARRVAAPVARADGEQGAVGVAKGAARDERARAHLKVRVPHRDCDGLRYLEDATTEIEGCPAQVKQPERVDTIGPCEGEESCNRLVQRNGGNRLARRIGAKVSGLDGCRGHRGWRTSTRRGRTQQLLRAAVALRCTVSRRIAQQLPCVEEARMNMVVGSCVRERRARREEEEEADDSC